MVELKELLEDAEAQIKYFDGHSPERYKTSVIYKRVLGQVDQTKKYVTVDELLNIAEKVECHHHTKADLLKMVKINYNHIKNYDSYQNLLKEFGINKEDLKPLAEVMVKVEPKNNKKEGN